MSALGRLMKHLLKQKEPPSCEELRRKSVRRIVGRRVGESYISQEDADRMRRKAFSIRFGGEK